MKKKKLEISDDLKNQLDEMRKILAGVSLGDEDYFTYNSGCGDYCRYTCSYYCEDACAGSCRFEGGNYACAYKSVSPPPHYLPT